MKEIRPVPIKRSLTAIKKFHLAFVNNCNLRCGYCSTRHGTFGARPAIMSREAQEDLMRILKKSEGPVSLEFGTGETFMAYSEFLDFVDTLQRERKKHAFELNISVTTNGTLLDFEKIDALVDRDIALSFSIDGDKTIHAKQRTDGRGRTYYDTAFENLQYYKKKIDDKGVVQQVLVQSVITDLNPLKYLDTFWRENNIPLFSITIALPYDYARPEQTEKMVAVQKQYLEDLKVIAFNNAARTGNPDFLNEYNGPSEILDGWCDLLLERKKQDCGVCSDLIAVDAWGNLFPCDNLMGSQEMRIGTLSQGVSPEKVDFFLKEKEKLDAECEKCRFVERCLPVCFSQRWALQPEDRWRASCEFSLKLYNIINESYEALG